MTELWKPVEGYEGLYKVSNLGRVMGRRGWILNPLRTSRTGRRWVILCDNAVRVRYFVHVLVLEAFGCKRPKGMVCRHLNGDPNDNRIENLAWGTRAQNCLDAVAHGTHPSAKLGEHKVREIKRRLSEGAVQRRLAAEYHVNPNAISKIAKGEAYRWVQPDAGAL